MTTEIQATETIDGFQLVIDALKLNGVKNIYCVPGIPITDLSRKMQKEGLRVISFRTEQHAGNAAQAEGFLTKKAFTSFSMLLLISFCPAFFLFLEDTESVIFTKILIGD